MAGNLGGDFDFQIKGLISATMDKKAGDEIEKALVAKMEKAAKASGDAFTEVFKEMAGMINTMFSKSNIKPIDIEKLLDLKDTKKALQEFKAEFSKTMTSIDNDVISDGINNAMRERLEQLKVQRKELISEYERLNKLTINKTAIQEINAEDIFEPLEITGNIKSEAKRIREEFTQAYEEMFNIDEDTPEYTKAIITAQKKANKLQRMFQNLRQSGSQEMSGELATYRELIEDKIPNVEWEFEAISEVTDYLLDLQKIENSLKSINVEIDDLTNQLKTSGGSAFQGMVDDVKDMEAALKRMRNEGENTYNKPKKKKLDALVGDEPLEIDEGLKALKFGYDKAVAKDLGWEEEYQWLVKFVQKYEQLEAMGKNQKTRDDFKDVYDSFKEQYSGAVSALKELRTLMDNPPTTKVQKDQAPDTDRAFATDKVNESLSEQEKMLANIKKLTGYIDEEYLSAGKHLSDFLSDLQGDSSKLDGELKEILSTLRLIDAEGKSTFDIKHNGEAGGGTTHSGALISDDFVLIERGDYQKVKDSNLPSATQKAYDDGVNVAKVLDYIPSKYTGGFFDVQTKAKGDNLFKDGVISDAVVKATEDQLRQLVNAFIVAREHGFDIENGGSNIVYDKEKGFSFYDLEEWSQEDKDYWSKLSEGEKKLRALEDALSIFAKIDGENLNRDYTNINNDLNREKFVDKLRNAIDSDALFSGLDYNDVFNKVFSEYASALDNFENMFKNKKKEQKIDIDDFLNNLFANEEDVNVRKLDDVKKEANTRRDELVAELDKYSTDVLTSKEADDNLQKFQESLETLKKENLLTEELEGHYATINERLETRANLLRQAEGYYDDVDDELTGSRVNAIDSEEQYRKDHIKPFDDTITRMSDSGLFSDGELEKFEKISKSMENRAKQLPFDELGNLHIDIEDINNIKELNELLEKRQKIMQTAGETAMLQHDSYQYEEEIRINQAIEERIALLKEADNVETGSGTGDVSSAEVERLTAELKASEENVRHLEDSLSYEKGRTEAEKEYAEAADRARREAEEELARIKAESDGKKLVDKDAPDDDSELKSLRAQLENEQQMRVDTERALEQEVSARFTAEERINKVQEENEQLRKQLANVDTTPNKGVKQTIGGDIDVEATQLKNVLEAVEAVTEAVNKKNKAFQNEGEIVGQAVGKEIKALSHLETQVTGINEELAELFGTLKNVKTNAKTEIKVKVEDVDTQKQPDSKPKETSPSEDTPKRSKADMNALEKDYEQLGRLWARLDDDNLLKQSAIIENLEAEIKRKQESLGLTEKEIAALKEKEKVAERAEENIIQAEKAQAAKDKKAADQAKFDSDVEKLAKQYEKLGKLQAEADAEVPGKKVEVEQLEKTIQQETERLGLLKEQNAEILKMLQSRRQEAQANQTALLTDKQRVKDEKAIWQAEVKAARGNAGVNVANSAVTAANRMVTDVIGDANITQDIEEKARELREAAKELAKTKNEVSRAIADGAEVDSDGLARQTKEVQELTEEMNKLMAIHKKYADAEDIGDNIGAFKDLDGDEYRNQLKAIAEANVEGRLRNVEFNNETKELIGTVKTGANTFTTYSFAIDEASGKIKKLNQGTKQTESFFEGMARKTKELAQYALSSISIYDVWNQIRNGVQYVREIDTAMTELRKVTNETEASYDNFLKTASATGSRIGSTISDFTQATATFAKLGYSMDSASKMAESAIVYQNVGDGIESAEAAAESIISTMKGFGLEASNTMAIVDSFNEVGNKFAIDSKGVGDALMRSASAMSMAGNSMHEAVGLAAAANTVVQNPEKVGTALKTLSLRLRAAKKEAAEAGEETDGMADSVTQLQAQLLKLSHGKVDIMLDANTFKNTTQIIREMSAAWKDMTDLERAEALELMAGKNQANVLAAIIQNFDIAERAIETSANSAGSALKENEKYLDSIEGKIQQFTNSLQAMWSKLISSDFIKIIIDAGTHILNAVESLGLVGTVVVIPTLATISSWFLKTAMDTKTLSEALSKLLVGLVSVKGQSLSKYFAEQMSAMNGVTKTSTKLGVTFKSLIKTFGQFFQTTAGKLTIMVGAIAAVIAISKSLIETTKEKEEKFQELSNTLDETKGKLSDLSSQLAETSARMDELLGKDTLTFTEQEELERLKAQSAELQRQIDLYETLKAHQQKAVNNQAVENADDYMNANFETGKGKGEYREQGATIGSVAGGAVGVKLGGMAGAALGTAAAAALGGKLGALAGTVVPVVGNIVGALLGAGLGALIGNVVGEGVADAKEQVGESIDDMYQRRIELQKELNEARAEYNDNPDSEKASKAYTEAEEALSNYDSKMSEHLNKMNSYYSSIDLGVYDPVEDAEKIRQLRTEMDEFYDTQDKWAILSGGASAKTNAINRLFGENASDKLKEVKKELEAAAKAGRKISLEEAFGPDGQGDLEAFTTRLHEMGIYAYEVEEAFKQVAVAVEDMMSTDLYDSSKAVGGVKAGVEGITSSLGEAKLQGYLTAESLDSLASTLGGVENLGDAWTEFAEVMSTNTSTIKEQQAAAEALVETYLDNELMSAGHLTPDQQNVYATQLENMGIWNAREYIKDRDMENMYKEIQYSADYDWDAIQQKWEEGSKRTVANIKQAGLDETKKWKDLTSEQRENFAEAMGEFKKVSAYDALSISEKYGYELEGGIDYVTNLMNKQNKLTQKMSSKQKDLALYKTLSNEYKKSEEDQQAIFNEFTDEVRNFNPQDYNQNSGAIWNRNTMQVISAEDYRYLKEENKKYKKAVSEYNEERKQLNEKLEEGKKKGFVNEDGTLKEDVSIKLQADYDKFKEDLEKINAQIEALTPDINPNFSLDMNQVKSEIEAVKTAFSESLSGTGMSESSIQSIEAIFGDLDNYDASELFDKTANGIQLNTRALRDLQRQQNEDRTKEINKQLEYATAEYNRLGDEIAACNDPMAISNKLIEQGNWVQRIQELSIMAAEYEGLTSAYQAWVDAQSGPDFGDNYDNITSGLEGIEELYKEGLIGTEKFRAAVQLMSDEDVSMKSPEELMKIYEDSMPVMKKYFTEGQEGARRFMGYLEKMGKATQDANGEWTFDFNAEDIAKELGISTEAVDILIDKLKAFGIVIDGDDLFPNLETAQARLNRMTESLGKLYDESGKEITIDFNTTDVDSLDTQIDAVRAKIGDPINGVFNLEGDDLKDAQVVLSQLLWQKEQLATGTSLKIDITSPTTDVEHVISLLDQIQQYQIQKDIAIEVGDTVTATEIQTKIDAVMQGLSTQEIPTELNIDKAASAENIATAWAEFKANTENGEILVNLGVNKDAIKNYNPDAEDPKSAEVDYDVNDKKVKKWKAPKKEGKAYYDATSSQQLKDWKPPTKKGKIKYEAEASARGTAFASGTAFAGGTWGASKSGSALGGELGPEIIVRDGRWFTIGDHGAEFFNYKKDDIIFNAEQSKQILEKGKITAGNRRGKALSEGTAFASGTAFAPGSVSGSGSFYLGGQVVKNTAPVPVTVVDAPKSKRDDSSKDEEDTVLQSIKEAYENEVGDLEDQKTFLQNEIEYQQALEQEVSGELFNAQVEAEKKKLDLYAQEKKELENHLATLEVGSSKWYDTKSAIWDVTHAIQEANIAIANTGEAMASAYEEFLSTRGEEYTKRLDNIDYESQYYENEIEHKQLLGYDKTQEDVEKLNNLYQQSIDLRQKHNAELLAKLPTLDPNSDEYATTMSLLQENSLASQQLKIAQAQNIKDFEDEKKQEKEEKWQNNFDTTKKTYDVKVDNLDKQISYIEGQIDQLEAQGEMASKGHYDALIGKEESKINYLIKQKEAFTAILNDTPSGTDDWYKVADVLWDIDKAIQDSTTNMIEYRKAIAELYATAAENITEAHDNINQLIDDRKSYIENEISNREAKDEVVPTSAYKELMQQELLGRANSESEKKALLDLYTQGISDGSLTEDSEEALDILEQIRQKDLEIQESTERESEYLKRIAEQYSKISEKMSEAYDNRNQLFEDRASFIENDIAIREANDEVIPTSAYKELMAQEREKRANAESELNAKADLYWEGINSGDLTEDSEEAIDLIEQIRQKKLEIQESQLKEIEYNKRIAEQYATISDKISEAYSNRSQLFDDRKSYIESEMSLKSTKGELIPTSMYDELIEQERENYANLESELNAQANLYWEGINSGDLKEDSEEAIAIIEQIRQKKIEMKQSEEAIAGYTEQQKDAYIAYYDKMMEAYSRQNEFVQLQSDFAQSYIDRLGTLNINVPDEAYKKMEKIQKLSNQGLKEQLEFANKELADFEAKGIDKNDPRYVEKFKEALDLEKQLYEGETKVLEYQQQIFDSRIDRFNQVIDRINDATQRMQNIASLLEGKDVATEDGEWTAEGLTRLGMAYQQMEYYKKASEEIVDQMDEVENAYKRGKISEKKYYETMQALESQQWSMINSYEDMKDAIVDMNEARIDMIEEGINKEIESYQELINLKKEELDAERDLYNFKKDTQQQTKEIAALERRIASMGGSTDASTIAERTKLEAELRELQSGLNDSYYNHAMDSQSDALDDELESFTKNSEDYIESLRESIKDIDSLVEQTFADVAQNGQVVLETLTGLAEEHGLCLDDYVVETWEDAEDASVNFGTNATAYFNEVYNTVETKTSDLTGYLSSPWVTGKAQAELFGTEATRWINDIVDQAGQEYQTQLEDILTYPWDQTSALTSWGEYARAVLTQNVVEYAEQHYKENLRQTLVYPWEQLDGQNSWGQNARDVLTQQVVEYAEGYYKEQLKATLDYPWNQANSYVTWGAGIQSVLDTVKSKAIATAEALAAVYDVDDPPPADDYVPGDDTPPPSDPYEGTGVDFVWGDYGPLSNYEEQPGNSTSVPETSTSETSTPAQITTGSKVRVDSGTRIYASSDGKGGGTQTYKNDPVYVVVGENNGYYKVRHHTLSKGITGWFRKSDVRAYARGTMGTNYDQWALTDESWVGEEITLAAGKNGQLQYLKKGSAVLPSDIAANLVEWGKLNPNMMNIGDMSGGIQMMSNYVNKPEIKIDVENFLKVDRVDQDSLPQLEKLMDKKIDTFAKQLNASIRKFK